MTIGEFTEKIWKQQERESGASSLSGLSLADYGHRRGWLEEQDVLGWDAGIERRTAARMIHEFLRKECGEADEAGWRGAEKLKDLFDCHVCVNHVAQVYAKGIMVPVEKEAIFGMKREVTQEEAEEIVCRIFSKEKRRLPDADESCRKGGSSISLKEALEQLAQSQDGVLVDVRTPEAFEESHLPGAVCIPLSEILANPCVAAEDKTTPLYFYCTKGHQSRIAAAYAAEAGYGEVFYFGLQKIPGTAD